LLKGFILFKIFKRNEVAMTAKPMTRHCRDDISDDDRGADDQRSWMFTITKKAHGNPQAF
jgi:hypothetical protein